jgi:uncharacterized protein (TIGR03437 family)
MDLLAREFTPATRRSAQPAAVKLGLRRKRETMRRGIVGALVVMAWPVSAQISQLICDPLAEPLALRSEGLTERTGTIVLSCQGTPNGVVDAGFIARASHTVTNRLDASGNADVTMAAETATGFEVVASSPRLIPPNTLVFEQFSFVLPASGRTTITVSNIRVATDPPESTRAVTVSLSFNGRSGVFLSRAEVTVGIPRRGLLSSATVARLVCLPSPEPEELTFSALLASTRFASVRVTEGEPTAFEPRRPGTSNGTRIVVRYSGFPAGTRVFVPDVIAGSSATRQTAAGDMGVEASGGQHTPGDPGSLLLSRVRFADDHGGGGALAFQPGAPGSGTVSFNSVGEVALRNGAGIAVFEVVDGNPTAIESAQIPTWFAVPRPEVNTLTPVVASARVTFGPLSTVAEASRSAPVVRFRDVEPLIDCEALGDCNANFFPRLFVDAPPLTFTATAGVKGFFTKHIRILNERGGVMPWTATVQFRNGDNWLEARPAVGVNNASILLWAFPENVTPGTYEAVLTIDAGPLAGTRTFPVTLNATPPKPPEAPKPDPTPRINNITSAANGSVTILAPGSLARILGERLDGQEVTVLVNGQPANVLFRSASRIDLLLPETAPGPRVDVQVRVDGIWSAPWGLAVEAVSPVVFTQGVLNQDGSVNAPDNPETPGRVLQVFLTGAAKASGGLSVRIHDRDIETPAYRGPAPGLTGVEQINFVIPADLPSMTTELVVCARPEGGPRRCSLAVPVHLRR